MNSWFHRSIKNKLTALVLLAVVPSVLLASLLSEWREAGRRIESKRSELAGIAAALAATVSEPLASGNTRQAANALKGMGSIPGITHVSVADASGATVFQFGNGILVGSAPGPGAALNISTYPVEAAVVHGGQAIGKLTLIADLSDVRAGLLRGINAAAFAALISALAGLILSLRTQRAIAQPIGVLTNSMRAIAVSRNFAHAIEKTTNDETGALVESFNAMLAEIRMRDGELALYHEALEQLVDERTRELAVATQVAERANAAKSDFLATMSHEIRTPMNGMMVMAELLAASELAPRARRQCDVILRSGQTLLAIINDILDLSKIEAGRMTLESVAVDPAQLIDDTLRLFSERAAGKGLQLASYVAAGVPGTIDADPVRIGQVLSNLVNNALKFTESGGVMVRVERVPGEASRLRFSVVDTGIGIAEDKVANIFDPFTQAEQSTTRRFGGTGIGLTICRRLVDAMGGELRVRSELGAGSEFWFELAVDAGTGAGAENAVGVHGKALIVAPEGPIRDAIALTATDLGLVPVVLGQDAVVGAMDELRSMQFLLAILPADAKEAALGSVRDLGCPVIAVSRFGDASADRLLRNGMVRDVIELPLGGKEARAAMVATLSGAAPIASSRAVPETAIEPTASFAGTRILAADDSALNREVLLEALSRLGADVTFVEDGAAALAAVQTGCFDLVFMDGSMPVMDGFAATRAIRAWEAEQERAPLAIIGLSAHVLGGSVDIWQSCGMSDFIAKPFTLAAIRRCLEHWLKPAARVAAAKAGDSCPTDATAAAQFEDDRILDPNVLESIAEMQAPGDDLVGRVVGLYIEHAPRALERLAKDISGGADTKAVAAAAHALKSLSRNVGAQRVGELCGRIEDDARRGLSSPISIDLVDNVLRDTVECLQSRYRQPVQSAAAAA